MVAPALECHWDHQDHHFNLVGCIIRAEQVSLAILTLTFSISITGLVVLGGHTRIKDPHANFRDSFSGTTGSGYGLANALVKINFAYFGFTNAFNVVAEVKVCHLFKHIQKNEELC